MTILYGFVTSAFSPGGYNPQGYRIVLAGKQGIFGETFSGGTNGDGGVYQLVPPAKASGKWSERILLAFSGNAKDGADPLGLAAHGGALYGTTSCCGPRDDGVVFRLAPPVKGQRAWKELVLHTFPSFTKGIPDGASPQGQMAFDSSGDLFGTAKYGGTSTKQYGDGVVWELTPPAGGRGAWKESILYRFRGHPGGSNPAAGLSRSADGSLWGTTNAGGTSNLGTVFKLTRPRSGKPPWNEQVVYSFVGGKSGANPGSNGVTIYGKDFLVGMTVHGGNKDNGVVYELTPGANRKWTENVLFRFPLLCGYCSDYSSPHGGITAARSGVLYGTTAGSGRKQFGTVFRLTPPSVAGKPWTETDVWTFDGGKYQGGTPKEGVVLDSSGAIFGTTTEEGPGGCPASCGSGGGAVFKLVP
jgi:uncharacterized repeat protein (TIGR03803 family)